MSVGLKHISESVIEFIKKIPGWPRCRDCDNHLTGAMDMDYFKINGEYVCYGCFVK